MIILFNEVLQYEKLYFFGFELFVSVFWGVDKKEECCYIDYYSDDVFYDEDLFLVYNGLVWSVV